LISNGIPELAQLIDQNDKLISINLSDNMLDTAFARQVGQYLQTNIQIQELDLSSNHIHVSFIKKIEHYLKRNQNIIKKQSVPYYE